MYGLVNKAIQDMVTDKFGSHKWLEIAQKAGFKEERFAPLKTYPDEITYKLVGAASESLALPPEKVLEAFGEYWILFTAKEGYGPIMNLFGSDLRSCLKNLNNLHARMGALLPNLTPPRFVVNEISPQEIEVQYFSKRAGLAPMVVGLLKGLGKKFNENVEITHKVPTESTDHQSFQLKFAA